MTPRLSPYDADRFTDDAPRFTARPDCDDCGGDGFVEEREGGVCKRVQCGTYEKSAKACPCSHACGNERSNDWHTCPYKEEINDDHETLCRCCPACVKECAYDV